MMYDKNDEICESSIQKNAQCTYLLQSYIKYVKHESPIVWWI
jgi:hypothetical protein